ncbi:hypothetical protein MHYP_G00322320 [Metynnis hypsauchen]
MRRKEARHIHFRGTTVRSLREKRVEDEGTERRWLTGRIRRLHDDSYDSDGHYPNGQHSAILISYPFLVVSFFISLPIAAHLRQLQMEARTGYVPINQAHERDSLSDYRSRPQPSSSGVMC